MNQDSREEGVTGKALKIVGGATVTAGAAYGVHKGMNSQRATNYIGKDFGEAGPGVVAKGITKYREKVNPFVDKTKENIKGLFAKTPEEAAPSSADSSVAKDVIKKEPMKNTVTNKNDITLKDGNVIKNPEKSSNTMAKPNGKYGEAGSIVVNSAGDLNNGSNINRTASKGSIIVDSNGTKNTPILNDAVNKQNAKNNIVIDSQGNTNGGKNINTPPKKGPYDKPSDHIAVNSQGDTVLSQKLDAKINKNVNAKEIVIDSAGNTNSGGNINTPNTKPIIFGADGAPIGQNGGGTKKIITNLADDLADDAKKIITKIL